MQRLPDSELDVMMCLWEAEGAVPRSYIDGKLRHRKLNANTVNTYLSRLEGKGFVSCQRQGKSNYYTSLVAREEYLSFEGSTMLGKLYNNSVRELMVSLAGANALGEDDIAELQALLDEMKKGETP